MYIIKLKILLFFVVLCFVANSQPINLNWVKTIGGADWDVVTDVKELQNNDILITGSYYDQINIEKKSYSSLGERDVFYALFDGNGNLKNSISIGSEGFDYSEQIVPLESGNYISVLQYPYPISWKGYILDTIQNNTVAFSWVDQEFNIQHSKSISGSQRIDIADVEYVNNNEVVACANFTDTLIYNNQMLVIDDEDFFVSKFDIKNENQWFYHFKGDGEDKVFDACISEKGDIIITGITEKGDVFGNEFLVEIPDSNMRAVFVATLSPDGITKNVIYPIFGYDIVPKSIVMYNNEIWIATSSKFLSQNINNETYVPNSTTDVFLLNINKKDEVKQITINGVGNHDIISMKVSGRQLFLTGTFSDELIFNERSLKADSMGTDIFIMSLNHKGEIDNAIAFSGKLGDFPCQSVANERETYLVGEFIDKLNVGGTNLISQGKEDVFIARLTNCGAISPPEIDIKQKKQNGETYWELDAGSDYIDYNWNYGMAKSRKIEVNSPGIYSVILTDEEGCSYEAEISIAYEKSVDLSINENDSKPEYFKLYPTVTNQSVYWTPYSNWSTEPFNVRIFDNKGCLLSNRKYDHLFYQTYTVDLNNFPTGSYQIEISGNGFRKVSKIILRK